MSRSDEFDDIRDIADAVCDGDVTPEQMQELEVLLHSSSEAKRFYLEYVGMHAHIKATSDPKMEIVMRRQVDEVIVRKAGSGDSPSENQTTPLQIEGDVAVKHRNHPFLLAACVVLAAVVIFLLVGKKPDYFLAEVTSGRLEAEEKGSLKSGYLNAGTFKAVKKTRIKLTSLDEIEITEGSRFQMLKDSQFELENGSLEIIHASGKNLQIKCAEFIAGSEGSKLKVDRSGNVPVITSGTGTVLSPARWRPIHYWPFEGKSDRAIDQAGDAHGIPHPGATKTKGLIGNGAYFFDNTIQSLINVGSGGGTAPATGTFAVTDGVTIEALIVPEWSGKEGDLDEIFRKDQTDKELRMLLSFQNDKGKPHVFPKMEVDESLGFGLYLVGQGYHELKLPLDGKEGRPMLKDLKDGKPHHVVATYDVRTGLKAMYIDGIMHASYNYPPGSKMLSGGPGIATIGNSPNNIKEAFSGVIDEVAFYGFALPALQIQEHYKAVQKGLNYYGLRPDSKDLPIEIRLVLPKNKTLQIDPLTGLPSSQK